MAYSLAKASEVRTLTMDLSDPKISHFLKRHYEISGIVADRYPGFHQLLAEKSVKMAKNGVSGPKVTILSDDLHYEDLATLMLGLYSTGSQSYTGAAVASMQAAADDTRSLQISFTSLCFYDSNQKPIGSCVTNQSFASGQYFPVSNVLNASNQSFTGAFAATYYDVTNQRFVAQMSTLSSDAIAASAEQTITAPKIVDPSNEKLKTVIICTSRKVNNNGNAGTCDYGKYESTDVIY